jgi:hypothetical protein
MLVETDAVIEKDKMKIDFHGIEQDLDSFILLHTGFKTI